MVCQNKMKIHHNQSPLYNLHKHLKKVKITVLTINVINYHQYATLLNQYDTII